MTTKSRVVRRKKADPEGDSPVVVYGQDDTPVIDLLLSAKRKRDKFRRGEYLHVSDVVGKCVRKIALSEAHGMPMPTEPITHSMAMTFAQGSALHDYVKSALVRHPDMPLWGSWTCKCGASLEERRSHAEVADLHCEDCGGPLDQYVEIDIKDTELLVSGSPDVILKEPTKSCYHILEIKSMSHEEWKGLVRAKPDHIVQVVMYWYLMRRAGFRTTSTVSVLYVTKGFVFKGQPFKEFVIDCDTALRHIDDYIEDAKAFARFRETGELPVRTKCATINCPEAKKCHVAMECFS